jgi:alkanesulfonate monooxygenase SsuD/methylene tetrahydromethanopterin reductase-like flavin-dependent oxidoreductase (luciferase family)
MAAGRSVTAPCFGRERRPGERGTNHGSGAVRPLKVGLFLTPWLEGGDGTVPRWSNVLARARRAEQAGFDSIWVSDHLLMQFGEAPRIGGWEGWSQIAALAAAVPRVEIGSLVMCVLWRNPAVLAKMADTVDEISGGRLILGVGAGWHEPEFQAFGFPYDRRIDRFAEALKIIHPLLRTNTVDFRGHWYAAEACELRPRGPRSQGPPLMIGALANRPRVLALAATYGDIWNAWLAWEDNTPAAMSRLREAVDAACHDAGRDPKTLKRSVSVQIDYPDALPNRDLSARPLRGTPEALAAALSAFADEGIDHVQVVLNPNTLASIERFVPTLAILDA